MKNEIIILKPYPPNNKNLRNTYVAEILFWYSFFSVQSLANFVAARAPPLLTHCRVARTLTSFRVLPFGLAWASLKSRLKIGMFASLSPILIELTSSVHLAHPPNTQRATPTGRLFVYRGSQIRTDDILLPKQTLYQAELHPEVHANIAKIAAKWTLKQKIF